MSVACAPAVAVVPTHGSIAARAAGVGAESGRVGARALTIHGAVKITGAAPDAARTLAGGDLADRSDDSPACAPNHAAEAVVLAAEAWEARMQAVPLPHVA
jgi:hypothetical protein